jgi:hypothetical protein
VRQVVRGVDVEGGVGAPVHEHRVRQRHCTLEVATERTGPVGHLEARGQRHGEHVGAVVVAIRRKGDGPGGHQRVQRGDERQVAVGNHGVLVAGVGEFAERRGNRAVEALAGVPQDRSAQPSRPRRHLVVLADHERGHALGGGDHPCGRGLGKSSALCRRHHVAEAGFGGRERLHRDDGDGAHQRIVRA